MSVRKSRGCFEEERSLRYFWKVMFGLNYAVLLVIAWGITATWNDFVQLSIVAIVAAAFSTFVSGMFTVVFLEPLVPVIYRLCKIIRWCCRLSAVALRRTFRVRKGRGRCA
jgi:membrane protein YdbS with pleckstrin-like domain